MRLDLGLNLGIRNATSSTPVAWTPAQLPSLAVWYDAADASTITLNGSTVSQWNDKSGNSRHLTQGAAASQPAYQVAGFNSRPTLSFNGTNQSLLSSYTLNFPLSIAIAAQNTETGAIVRGAVGSGTNSYALGILTAAPSDRAYSLWNPNLNRGVYINNSQSTNPAIVASSAASNDEATWSIHVNGSSAGSVIETAGTPVAPSALIIGYSGMSSEYWYGRISEVVATTNVLATSDREKLEGYLAHKWGLTANLPVDHPFKNTPPTV